MFRILVAKEQVHGCNLKFQRLAMPIQSKVKQYTANELDLGLISNKAYERLRKRPFQWQLEAAAAILCGKDVVLDVGTGSGKTLCFSLPLLLNEQDVSLTISPLTALMIDQVNYYHEYTLLSPKLFSKYLQINKG